MNFGQNLYNWFLSNAQSLVLLAIVVIGLYLGFKREFSKLIGFLIIAIIAVPNAFYRQRLFHLAISLTSENYSQPLKWSLHLCSGLQSHFSGFQILPVHKLAFVCVLKQVHICRPLSALPLAKTVT